MKHMSLFNKISGYIKNNENTKLKNIIDDRYIIKKELLDIVNISKNTLLHLSCINQNIYSCKLLYTRVQSEKVNKDGKIPFYYVIEKNNIELCKFFIENRTCINDDCYFTAIKSGSIEIIKLIFNYKNKKRLLNLKRQNILIVALKNKRNYNIIDYLSDKCDINEKDIYGRTSMHYAAVALRAGHNKIISQLARKGGDIVYRDENNLSPIDYLKNIELRIQVYNLAKKHAIYYRRRFFLLFLARYKFLSSTHNSVKLYNTIFSTPEIYRSIMSFL